MFNLPVDINVNLLLQPFVVFPDTYGVIACLIDAQRLFKAKTTAIHIDEAFRVADVTEVNDATDGKLDTILVISDSTSTLKCFEDFENRESS